MTFFEDFSVGDRMRHPRGKTITDVEVASLCHLVMNTHQAHFNAQFMEATPFERPINFGGITAAIVVGLAMQDTGEHALAELGMAEVRFPKPVVAGDTLYALSEVLCGCAHELERVEHERAMRVEHALWIAGRARRVAHRRRGALVRIFEVRRGRRVREERLVIQAAIGRRLRRADDDRDRHVDLPANLLKGQDAQDVAAYVAAVAANPLPSGASTQ